MRHLIFSAWAAGLVGISIAGAQTVPRKEPAHYAVTERASRVEAPPPGMRLGLRKPREFALAPLSGSEVALLSEPGPRLRLGVHRRLPADILSTGRWEVTSEGAHIWRMAIGSPGSTGLRVEFRNFSAGNGNVWLHDGTHVAGPYTGRGVYDDGHFWSASVPSASVVLEYQPDPDTPAEAVPPFEIHTIAHRAAKVSRGYDASASATPTGPPPDPAAYCNLDPNCYPEWKGAMSMVAQITFEDSSGSEFLCSATLVGTRDNSFKPYLLTAGHCIHDEATARTVETFWTYQNSSCSGTPPTSNANSTKSTLGAHLLASGTIEQGDYSLVLLKDVPSGVTFSGWDVTDPPISTEVTGIHHPAGSWKRISFGQRVADQTVNVEGDTAPGNLYFQIMETKGIAEPGSSGSALFSSPGVIVGTLTYGPGANDLCQVNPLVVGYARFSNAYQYMKDYLEDLPAAEVTADKAGLNFAVSNHATPPGQTVRLSTQASGPVTYKLRADAAWLQVSTITGTVSASAPAPVTITVDPSMFDQAGQYSSTVTLLSGTAPPVFINVTTTVAVDQSNVVASITPGQVHVTDGQWSFTIQLAETAGAATQLTSVKVNGTDYSSNIKSWFGTDRIAAKGTISAPLSGSGVFPAGTQYLEFRGIDSSGQHWYRTATVSFQ
ncbi:MAG TPA: hypothetical protein VGZ73_31590 [Bryobacteraceae bacterium]|nr:hypothetical protein [Bryobacteraceae bacterium]